MPIFTPKFAGNIIIPAHQGERGLPLLELSFGSTAKIEGNDYFGGKVRISIIHLQTEGYHTIVQCHFFCQLLDQTGSCTDFHAPLTSPPEPVFWDHPEEVMSWLPDTK